MSNPQPNASAWLARVRKSVDAGQLADAAAVLRQWVAADPGEADAWSMLGAVLLQMGEVSDAETALRQCLQQNPQQPDALANLASILMSRGDTAAALSQLKQVHQINPRHLGAWLVLARSRLMLGDAAGAEKCLRIAESIHPDLPAYPLFQLAGVLQERKAFAEAVPYYERAIAKEPDSFLYRSNLADMLCNIGEVEKGLAQHREILAREPDRLRSHLALQLTLPGVHASAEAVRESRSRFEAGLAALHARLDSFRSRPREEIESDIRWSNYLLAYQGEDDKSLQARFADLQAAILDGVAPTLGQRMGQRTGRAVDAPIRIGFASSFFYQCTVGWYFSSWIRDLDPARFQPFVYSLGPVRDALSDSLAASSTWRQMHHLSLFRLADAILADELDVLVFPELGLCPTTFALAAMRLAPLQCAGWGHPVTSGHRTIDLYFTSDLIEPDDADSHYTERLVRLPGLGTRYPRPAAPEVVTRGQYSIPEGRPLALVSQSLFKIHPDNDVLYASLLAAVPGTHLLFYEDSFDRNTKLFADRLTKMELQQGRDFTFLPRMSRAHFLGINCMADVMLDTLHWSGGNTSLDALSMGLPLVTWPGRFMRGRQSLGMLRALRCEGLAVSSAEAYVAMAATLLTDANIRDAWRTKILAGANALYDQPGAPEALQAAIAAAVGQQRTA